MHSTTFLFFSLFSHKIRIDHLVMHMRRVRELTLHFVHTVLGSARAAY